MKKLPWLGLGLVALGFLLGLLHLFKLRFEAGDSYPPYSSLRADPLGAKALFDSLDALRPARRHIQLLNKLGDGRDSTLFWLGESADELKFVPDDYRTLDTFVRSGGRLVLSLKPVFVRPRTNVFLANAAARRGAAGRGNTNAPPTRRSRSSALEDPRTEVLGARWGFTIRYRDLAKSDSGEYQPDTAELREAPASPVLPVTIKVWTAVGLVPAGDAWRTLYSRGTGTNTVSVVLERDLGRGTVVLCADSYYFSNEALRDERQAGLLAWFAGSARQVVFEETHLGVSESPGIATLARKYGLQTFFGALLILAGLFLWKNVAGFMPPYEEQLAADQGDTVEGRDSGTGFVNLLRRHIAPTQLLRVCLEQWNAHVARTRKPSVDRLEAMQRLIDAENALEPRQRDPVGTYRRFCQILAKRSGVAAATFELSNPGARSHSQPRAAGHDATHPNPPA